LTALSTLSKSNNKYS